MRSDRNICAALWQGACSLGDWEMRSDRNLMYLLDANVLV